MVGDELDEKSKDYLVKLFLNDRGIAKQHIHSFDHFLSHGIKNILKANNYVTSDIDPNFYLKYLDIRVGRPVIEEGYAITKEISPNDCRLRNATYSANIYVDVEYTRGQQRVIRSNLLIGKIPIMLQSSHCVLTGKNKSQLAKLKECPIDTGGYFIVKGREKVILIQEQMTKNRILIHHDPSKGIYCTVNSASDEIKSKTTLLRKHDQLLISLNVFIESIPVCVIFKAMGIVSDQEIVQMIANKEEIIEKFIPSIQASQKLNVFSQDQALNYLQQRLKTGKIAMDALNDALLTNVKVSDFSFKPKAVFLALMVRKLIQAELDSKYIDDRDYYGIKRLELAGHMIAYIFEDSLKKLNAEITTIANKMLPKPKADQFDVLKHIRPDMITRDFVYSLSTGNWVIKRFKMNKAGVSQELTRLSYIAAISNMTKIASQFEKSRKVSGPRSIISSQWGMVCPSDTPEGESCGLIKNLALMAHVTVDIDDEPIRKLCYNLGVMDASFVLGTDVHDSDHFLVMLNGSVIGIIIDMLTFVKSFKLLRRKSYINKFVSIYMRHADKSINISSDGGRLCRPYLIVESEQRCLNGEILRKMYEEQLCFDDLINLGTIEFLDVNEQNNSNIALYDKDIQANTTHMEIDPMTILGVCVALVPYPHHNQSPRNTYQCAMGKQAMGTIAYNQLNRIDTLMNLLVYPQKPLVKSKTLDIIDFDKIPAGQNATICVLSSTCYDIEDATIINRASLDRGFGRCIVYKKTEASLKKYPNQTFDIINGPLVDPETLKNTWKHECLDYDGICMPGSSIANNQVLVNKAVPAKVSNNEINTQTSLTSHKELAIKYKGLEPSTVESVMLTSNTEDHFLMKVKLRQVRRPEIGDKFSSRHGQKGVCGLIVNQEDMPFSESGICPDIIMNPHGYPSRMTVGKLMELVGSKAAALLGKFHYGTAFGGSKLKDIENELEQAGYNYKGKDILISGTTGEMMEAYVFNGPVYYQKLKHMVVDKIHARSRGPRSVLTRQPTEGRARDGGLRFGEMEKDCMIAYGVSSLILERLMLSSDVFVSRICGKCGFFASQEYCHTCKSSMNIASIKIPYGCKLLLQELVAMNIMPRLHLDDFNKREKQSMY